MRPIILNSDNSSADFLYIQLYDSIKASILSGDAVPGEKMPSLRKLADDLDLSITTVQQAYSQLAVEGYIESRPQSGYYVNSLNPGTAGNYSDVSAVSSPAASVGGSTDFLSRKTTDSQFTGKASFIYDSSCFDFNKWKKCASRVFTDRSEDLLYESDPQGEPSLRKEISEYLHLSRGVYAPADRIVIGAGTQQITSHLGRILHRMGINLVSLETPGYLPVQSIFHDSGFSIQHIPVSGDGIRIEKLPVNIQSAVYVNPSNQFPTGAVMPIGRRYELLNWAAENDSYILEDDYDSELRYFGKPVPALQSLDHGNRVVYLGSFSSTLFPAIKISYMVLPEKLFEIFGNIKSQYTQTCSKAEQLTLAYFMSEGYYETGIRRLRNSNTKKLDGVLAAFNKYAPDFVEPVNTKSGITLTLKVRSIKQPVSDGPYASSANAPADSSAHLRTAERLADEAGKIGLQMIPISEITDQETTALSFYYSRLPLEKTEPLIEALIKRWNEL